MIPPAGGLTRREGRVVEALRRNWKNEEEERERVEKKLASKLGERRRGEEKRMSEREGRNKLLEGAKKSREVE